MVARERVMAQGSFSSASSGMFRFVYTTLILVVAACPLPTRAQNNLDDVHVVPRADLRAATTAADLQPGLDTHTKPMKVDVDLVLVPVTVTDEMNRLVKGLSPANFEVLENKHLQEIKHFSSEDVPVSLGVIFDASGSMSSKMKVAREAVLEFLKSANPQDEFFLETFGDRPAQTADFTTSIGDIQSRLAFVVPKGRTSLLDAIYLGLGKMRQAQHPKKALLIISDGGDNHSRYSERELKSLVKESDVMIYAVGIYDSCFRTDEEMLGPYLLSEITSVTGGRAFTVSNPNDLPLVAKLIGTELRNQYVLGYRPTSSSRNGKWHKIGVSLKRIKGLPPLHVYAKTGYYAPSE